MSIQMFLIAYGRVNVKKTVLCKDFRFLEGKGHIDPTSPSINTSKILLKTFKF